MYQAERFGILSKTSDKKIVRYLLQVAVLAFIIASLAECFLFNYRYWESKGFQPERVDISQIHTKGLAVKADGTATASDILAVKAGGTTASSGTGDGAWIEIPITAEKVKNLYFNPFPDGTADGKTVTILPSSLDASGTDEVRLARTEVVSGIPESSYLRLHLNSNAT